MITNDITVVENLGSSGLTFDSSAPMTIPYSVTDGDLMVGSAPLASGTNVCILNWNSCRLPALDILEYRPANNQSNTRNALAANNVALPRSSPCFFASNNIVDFIVTGEFAACTSNCLWGDTHEQYANTSVYLGGKI